MVHMLDDAVPFIVESIPLQYHRNNRIASCCKYRNENFQYRPTLIVILKCHNNRY